MKKLKQLVVNYLPFLGKIKRFYKILSDFLSSRKNSYSQHKEDLYLFEKLKGNITDGSIFVDVGANHPSDISNTYLFYRLGYHGIAIEPNQELIRLHKLFRKKDIALQLGCGYENKVARFTISKTPVLSSFEENTEKPWKIAYLPVLKLEDILRDFKYSEIFLLSIDVEGWNYQVCLGSKSILTKVIFVCVETDSETDETLISNFFLSNNFAFDNRLGCNLIFVNKNSKIYN